MGRLWPSALVGAGGMCLIAFGESVFARWPAALMVLIGAGAMLAQERRARGR